MDAAKAPMGFLIVGAGFLGTQRAAAVAATRGLRLLGIVDSDFDRARAVAAWHGVAAFVTLHDALARTHVDAVVVATPHGDHAKQVRQALEAGKHVLCEKPLAIDPLEARSLAILADDLERRLATGMNHRFYPPVRDALKLVASWSIGRVESVRAQIGHKASAEFLASWHTDLVRSGGGALMDNGPHACDLVRRFLGEVVAAQGYVRHAIPGTGGCESEAFALYRNHDRGVAEVRASWTLEDGYLTIDVRGSDGHLHIETAPWRLEGVLADGRKLAKSYLSERIAERLFRLRNGCERSLVRELEAFADLESAHPRPGATGWDGCRATEMVEAVYRSARTHQEVDLQPLLVHLPSARRRVRERDVA